ncbi:DUF6285 domain-containing protein [Xenophilus arseniciresistens]|uniref:DUF6285 domain-containing protein n=1 Tax=Xenophilus arseniciresistens TaxID=1283306 RepID=A0AAE3NDC9_9BURK|nr:DUF6285 domain-containing protein [Xenophilus arseniciresistens]MDA7418974.1 DUF6285 domain-containing protein [Xenophilus arseniciresistens]
MPAFVPSAATLLQAAATDLEREVLPVLSGFPRFRTRVIVNMLRLLTRELALGAAADAAEQARLQALLDTDSEDLTQLRAQLAQRIEAGTLTLDDEALLRHLRETLRDALAIDNPGWTGGRG